MIKYIRVCNYVRSRVLIYFFVLPMLICVQVKAQQYCIPSYNSNINCRYGKDINDFALMAWHNNSILDTTTNCTIGGHDNRTSFFVPIELIKGDTYYGQISTHSNSTGMVKMWLDFNGDNTFQVSDAITGSIPLPIANTLYSYSIHIPISADTGLRRMRVRLATNANIDPCATQPEGESHDYMVHIIDPVVRDIGVYNIICSAKNGFFCSGKPIDISVVIKNSGIDSQSGFNVQLQYSGAATGIIYVTCNNIIPPHGQDTIMIEFIPPFKGMYMFNIHTALNNDLRPENDTMNGNILVDTTPIALLNDTAICWGNFPIILNAGNVGCKYLWNTTSNGQFIQIFSPGIYSVKITSKLGCLITDTIRVVQNLPPTITGIAIDGTGNHFTCAAGNPQYVTDYLWDFGDGTTASGDTIQHSYTIPGMHKITLVVSNICGTDTATFDVMVFATDIETIPMDNILLYPNPASHFLYFNLSGTNNIKQLLITNETGQTVYSRQPGVITGEYKIDFGAFVPGNYLLTIQSEKENFYKMFCVKL